MSKRNQSRQHKSLEDDITSAGGRLRTKSITGKRKSRSYEDDDNTERTQNNYIDAKSSRKILTIAQDLVDEDVAQRQKFIKSSLPNQAFESNSRFDGDQDIDGQDVKYDEEEEEEDWLPDEDGEVIQEDLDPEDMAVYNKFLHDGEELGYFTPSLANLSTGENRRNLATEGNDNSSRDRGGGGGGESGQTTNLADLILQRIREKEQLEAAQGNGMHDKIVVADIPPDEAVEIPPRVVETFAKVGQLLSRYRSGPLPKPFKVLPTLPQWPELLNITRPENWTPHSVYRGTKIFISSKPSDGQYYCETVLLDRVREDIHETRKLNVHLYNAIKAAFYRPSAFFKGFLFPLVQSGTCTLREAHIISSVFVKIKIPVLHSAAALLRLCEIAAEQTNSINSEAAGAANIFIRVLLAKKYALPYKVVDALVFHFLRFRAIKSDNHENDDDAVVGSKEAKLPVLWHQTLLIFAQTYRNEITEDQREALLDLLLGRGHRDIGPEVRRELIAGRNRDVEDVNGGDRDTGVDDGDDTMDIGH